MRKLPDIAPKDDLFDLRFLMQGVLSIELAVLLKLELFLRFLPVFGSGVIPALALGAL
jgi:hypothetical protein